MSFFRKKGKYWYFVERIEGKEVQHYIGNDQKVKEKLTSPNPLDDNKYYNYKIGKISKCSQVKLSIGGAMRIKFLSEKTKIKICQSIAEQLNIKEGYIILEGISYTFNEFNL